MDQLQIPANLQEFAVDIKILNTHMKEEEIYKLTLEQSIRYFMNKNILKEQMNCSSCKKSMNLYKSTTSLDKYSWCCTNIKCSKKRCRINLRKYSKIEKFKISFRNILILLKKYSKNE